MRRGLARRREQAQDAIAAGTVLVGGRAGHKPARLVAAGEPLAGRSEPPARFVSRGGEKLDAALERFAVDVAGRAGRSTPARRTGGFTDCLLQHGAARWSPSTSA